MQAYGVTTCIVMFLASAPMIIAQVRAGLQGTKVDGPLQTGAARQENPAYVLGAGDEVTVRVLDAPEIGERPVRIDMDGYLRLPMVGRVRAAHLTIEQLETEVAKQLKTYLYKPDVSIGVSEYRSQPVSIIGSVKNPGVHQLQGRKTLIEVLSLAGGLTDDAGPAVQVTRAAEWGRIPLSQATRDSTGRFYVAEVKLKSILTARDPEQNIAVMPHDVLSVPRAEIVYVTGTVVRSGGFVLNDRDSISVLQALSLAGGLDRAASPQNARILRATAGAATRTEMPVDLRMILAGKAEDLALKPDDILFIPSSTPKKAAMRVVEAAVQAGTGIVIWRR